MLKEILHEIYVKQLELFVRESDEDKVCLLKKLL